MKHTARSIGVLPVLIGAVGAGAQVLPEELEPLRGVALDGTELVESSCSVLATNEGGSPTLRDVPGMHVLGRRKDDPLVLSAIDGVKINAIVCWRSAARFAEGDYLVLERLGYPLYVKTESNEEAAERTVVLEMSGGQFRIRLLSGPAFTEAERDEMLRVLDQFQSEVGAGA